MDKISIIITVALLVSGCGTGLRNPQKAKNTGHPHQTTTDGSATVRDADSSPNGKDADSSTDATNPVVDAGADSETFINEAGIGSDALIGTDAKQDSTPPVDASQEAGNQDADQIQDAGQDSGDGSQDASKDAGQVPVCTPQDLRCLDQNIQICTNQGQWLTDFTCPYICTGAGNCVGSCAPSSTTCSGNILETCSSTGTWVSGTACPYACFNGACTGVCKPGNKRCSGNDSQTCNSSGQWTTDQTCPYVCGGAGICSGSCVPTTRDCSSNTPRTCDSTGSWVNGTACSYVCSGAGVCSGVCTPGNHRCNGMDSQTCNSSGNWITNQTCPYVCSGSGTCSGSCIPTSKQCNEKVPQTCDNNGAWVSGASCPFVCSSGACSGVCAPGARQCSGQQIQTCNGNGQWAMAVNCPAVANATSYCSGGSCEFSCNLDYDDCDGVASNGCEVNVNTDGNNCGTCGHSCCGGACGSGVCGVYDTGIYSSIYDVDKDNIYWVYGNLNVQPRLGGTSTTIITPSATNNYRNLVYDVKVNKDTIFWSTIEEGSNGAQVGGSIFSVPIAGNSNYSQSYNSIVGTSFTISSTHGAWTWYTMEEGTGHLALDSTRIIWGDNDSGYINWTSYNPPAQQKVTNAPIIDGPVSFASDNTYVYVSSSSDKTPLTRTSLTASPTTTNFVTSTSTNYNFGHLAIDATNLYYIFYNSVTPSECGIWKKPLNGGTAVQLILNPGGTIAYDDIATDGIYIFYVDHVRDPQNYPHYMSKIYKVSINGGTSQLLTTIYSDTEASQFKVSNQCLYWYNPPTSTIQAIAVSP